MSQCVLKTYFLVYIPEGFTIKKYTVLWGDLWRKLNICGEIKIHLPFWDHESDLLAVFEVSYDSNVNSNLIQSI